MLKKLWLDEGGALISVELILLIVITVIGITVGMVCLRDAVVTEFQDVSCAIGSIDCSYGWSSLEYTSITTVGGVTGESEAYVNGSTYDSTLIEYDNSVVATPLGDPDLTKTAYIDETP